MPGAKLLSSHRLAYEVMKTQIEQGGQYVVNNEEFATAKKLKNIRAAQSFLWSEVPLTPNSSTYVFNVKNGVANQGQPGIVPGELRLKDQNVFFTYALAMYLRILSTGSGNTSFQNQLYSFPSGNFGGVGGFALPIDRMHGLWTEGVLSIKTNGEEVTPAWDMGQHLFIPERQIQVAVTPGSNNNPFDQKDMSDDGMVAVEPNWILNGGNDNLYTVTYPSNYASFQIPDPGTTNWRLSLVMKWQGFLAQNASTIMNPGGGKS